MPMDAIREVQADILSSAARLVGEYDGEGR